MKADQSNNYATYPSVSPSDLDLPDGVSIPTTVDPSILTGDMLDVLRSMSVRDMNVAFEQYDFQVQSRGDEIRNKRAYLKGILKSGGQYGLPHGVIVPPSVTQSMLEGDMLGVLKNMSVRDINSCLRDYDEQIKKKEGIIRNKAAYLLGIIKSGPHYSLPQGVVIPNTLSISMLQGELLDTIQRMPASHINIALSEYDEQILKKGASIRNKPAYLLGIIKRRKKRFEDQSAEQLASQELSGSPIPSQQSGSPHPQHMQTPPLSSPQDLQQKPSYSPSQSNQTLSTQAQHFVVVPTAKNLSDETQYAAPATKQLPQSHTIHQTLGVAIPRELSSLKPGETQETLNLVTESFVKVTNELVTERQARNDLEELVKEELRRREEINQNLLKLMSELSNEKEQRERSALEVERLKNDLAFERSLRETAVRVVHSPETVSVNGNIERRNISPEREKLTLELSIERGLREKTEKLLLTAENRIAELSRELQYTQEKLQKEQHKSPFGNWIAGASLLSGDSTTRDGHDSDSNMPGISELVSLASFDPSAFKFGQATDSRIVKRTEQDGKDRLASELDFVSSAYGEDEIRINDRQIIRFLRLDVSQKAETVRIQMILRIPDGYPIQGIIDVDAAFADDSVCSEHTRICAEEALPSLVEACRSEAQGCAGSEALLSVLTTADYWAKIDWFGFQTKINGVGPSVNAGTSNVEICRLLINTEVIEDVFSIKHMATKHGLGGYIKVGRPAFLLVEGLEASCNRFLENLNQVYETTNNNKFLLKSSSFTAAGKVLGQVADLRSGMSLPGKLVPLDGPGGTEKLRQACQKCGLGDALQRFL